MLFYTLNCSEQTVLTAFTFVTSLDQGGHTSCNHLKVIEIGGDEVEDLLVRRKAHTFNIKNKSKEFVL